MGKTLLGIDLDESPVGGLIESLLSEDDFEKLTDGGRNADDEDGSADTDTGTGVVDDTDGSSGEATERTDDGGHSDETTVPVGTGDDTDAPWDAPGSGVDTPSPGAEPSGPTDSIPSAGDESAEDGGDGWKAKLRPLLLKTTVALALLAVVAFVAYRYLGTVRDVAGDKLPTDRFAGGDEDDEPADATGFDDGSARRRGKSTPDGQAGESATGLGTDEDDSAAAGRPQSDSDAGALVGLAMLALVAALVRKFGEDRPRDPLVDGPLDDGE